MREIEAKIALQPGELEALQSRMSELGFAGGPFYLEENCLFDSLDGDLRAAGHSLRIRWEMSPAGASLTYKGPADRSSPYKSREEREIRIEDGDEMQRILERIGFRATGSYRKDRQLWELDGDCAAMLDRLSIGDFIEVEGPDEAAVTAALAMLGLGGRPHIQTGYAELLRRAGVSIEPSSR